MKTPARKKPVRGKREPPAVPKKPPKSLEEHPVIASDEDFDRVLQGLLAVPKLPARERPQKQNARRATKA